MGSSTYIYLLVPLICMASMIQLRIGSESYQEIWYRLHTAIDVGKWTNVLALSKLIVSLPFKRRGSSLL